MTPETARNRTVELYRAIEFPWPWELDSVLLRDLETVDPTLVHHDGRLWLFTTLTPPGGVPHDELCVYFADDLRGPWHPHARNPVVSDVRSARSAGALLRENGVLHRPAQNCSVCYGHSITLNRIVTLTPAAYAEEPAGSIEPSWPPKSLCTHTLNASEHWLVTDGKRMIRRS